MVEINHKIIITGILALSAIQVAMIICDHDTIITTSTIVGAIALAIGVVIPIPKMDNNRGVFIWQTRKNQT